MRWLAALLLLGAGLPLTAVEASGYALFPGDLIRIEVFGHSDLQVDARVPATGDITFPLIGALAGVAGRSPEDLAAEVTRLLADGYLRSPSVTVQIREYGARTAWLVGSVRAPGPIALDPLRTTTALQAIGAASGFSDDANRAGAQIIRDDPAKPGAKTTIPIPETVADDQDIPLQHGDVIIVPRADRIYVLGQVQSPGAHPVPPGGALTVSKAISLAGGFARFAKESRVQLVRPGAQPLTIDIDAVLAGKDGIVDPLLRAGDTVFVPESRF